MKFKLLFLMIGMVFFTPFLFAHSIVGREKKGRAWICNEFSGILWIQKERILWFKCWM